jgi:hypothetical protein
MHCLSCTGVSAFRPKWVAVTGTEALQNESLARIRIATPVPTLRNACAVVEQDKGDKLDRFRRRTCSPMQ